MVQIDGSDQDLDKPINKDKCDRNVNVELEVTGLANTTYDIRTGEACKSDPDDCKSMGSNFKLGSNVTKYLNLNIRDLLEADSLNCEDRDYTVTVLLVETSTSSTTDASAVSDSNNITCSISVDTEGLAAPTSLKGGTGENAIEIKWEYDFDDNDDLDEFRVYYEVCSASSTLCDQAPSSCVEASDASTVDTDAGRDAGESSSSSGSEVNLEDLPYESAGRSAKITLKHKVDVGQWAAVVVVALDEAGNISSLSNVACIKGVRTLGFCDLMKQEGKTCKNGCTVSLVGAEGPVCSRYLLGVVVLFLLVAARRSKKSPYF